MPPDSFRARTLMGAILRA